MTERTIATSSRVDALVEAAGELSGEEQAELLRRLAMRLGQPGSGQSRLAPQTGEQGNGHAGPASGSLLAAAGPLADGPVNPHEYADLTYQIIGCALHVHRQLGSGHREQVYQRAMEVELAQAGLAAVAEPHYPVYATPLGDHLLGYYIPDLVVAKQVVVELKALSAINNQHVSQVIGYLKITGCAVGLLLNFGERRLHPRRILRPNNIDALDVEHQWLYKPGGS